MINRRHSVITLVKVFLMLAALCDLRSTVHAKLPTTSTLRWTMIQDEPPGRQYFMHVRVSETASLYGFGILDRDPFPYYTSDLWMYNATSSVWSIVATSSNGPKGRRRPEGVVIDSTLYIYGGGYTDFWKYNLTTNTWTEITATGVGAVWPSVTSIKGMIRTALGIGIISSDGTQAFDYDLKRGVWEHFILERDTTYEVHRVHHFPKKSLLYILVDFGLNMWTLNATTTPWKFERVYAYDNDNTTKIIPTKNTTTMNVKPFVRKYLGYLNEDGDFVMLGGFSDYLGRTITDLWKFNMNKLMWEDYTRTLPSNIMAFDTTPIVRLSEKHVIIHGGWAEKYGFANPLYRLDDRTGAVTIRANAERRPTARSHHITVTVGKYVYIAFGFSAIKESDEYYMKDVAWQLDVQGGNQWTMLNTLNALTARSRCSAIVRGASVYIFGGRTSQSRINEVVLWTPERNEPAEVLKTIGSTWEARENVALAYENYNTQSHIVAFGGVGSTPLNDMWLFAVTTNTWIPLTTTSSVKPTPRQSNLFWANNVLILAFGYGESWYEPSRWFPKIEVRNQTVEWTEGREVEDLLQRYVTNGQVLADPREDVAYFVNAMSDCLRWNISSDTFSSCNFDNNVVVGYNRYVAPYLNRWIMFGGLQIVSTYTHADLTVRDHHVCLPGSIRNITTGECTFCRRGTYFSFSNSGECLNCPVGSYGEMEGGIGNATCVACASQSYQPNTGSERCLVCPDNYTCPIGSVYPFVVTPIDFGVRSRRLVSQATTDMKTETIQSLLAVLCITVGILLVIFAVLYWRARPAPIPNNPVVHALLDIFEFITRGTGKLTQGEFDLLLDLVAKPSTTNSEELRNYWFYAYTENREYIEFNDVLQLLYIFHHDVEQQYRRYVDPTLIGLPVDVNINAAFVKPRFQLQEYDSFGAVLYLMGSVPRLRTTSLGGAITLLCYLLMLVLTATLIADYVENNVVETKFSLPQFFNMDSHAAAFLEITMVSSVPENERCACSDYDSQMINMVVGSHSQKCTRFSSPSGVECRVVLRLENLALKPNAVLRFDITSDQFYASNIQVGVMGEVGPLDVTEAHLDLTVDPALSFVASNNPVVSSFSPTP